jgi:hypothetical protein
MAKAGDLYVGSQLFCGVAEHAGAPLPPVGFGVGGSKIRGAAFLPGPTIMGSPFAFTKGPNINDACVMIGRCGNPEALPPPPSILKVSSFGFPPTPIDIAFGDPVGPVGITCFTEIINISNNTSINILSPTTVGTGILNWFGAKTLTGVVAETGVEARAGAEVVSAATCDNGNKFINGALDVSSYVVATKYFGDISACSGKKDFDIPHPTKDGWRLRHVCIEGPTADVYIRGKLKDSNVINLPEYWKGLVDPETITINITPIGSYQELFVEKIEWGSKVIIKNNAGSSIHCHYTISGERIDVDKNIPEYAGTYDDYPGNNDEYMNTVRFLPMKENV